MLSHATNTQSWPFMHTCTQHPPSRRSLLWKSLCNGHNWTRSPSRLNHWGSHFREAEMHISSTLTISPSLTVFEEILRRACEARLMENFTGFTRLLKEMLSVVRHMRKDGQAGCVNAERKKACGKSIFTAVFGLLFVDTALSLWIPWFVRVKASI